MKSKDRKSMSDYSSAIKVFSNIRSLRALARETDYEVLTDIAEKLNKPVRLKSRVPTNTSLMTRTGI
ncbi:MULTISPECIES: H-NS family histone-like protein [Klebsiella pneumoniae complex]